MLKFYYHPRSTYSRRVVIALAEKAVPHVGVVIDMGGREHRSPDYLSLNPYGRVPAIEEDGLTLYESAAILRYLDEAYPDRPLLPVDPRQRALADMHTRLCDIQFARYVGVIIFPKRFLPRERWDLDAMAAAKAEIEKHLAILEQQLMRQDYLVADQFTLADLAYIPFLDFLPLMEITPPPEVAAWRDRLLARPSVERSKPDV
jgi:glutathione S-transferase